MSRQQALKFPALRSAHELREGGIGAWLRSHATEGTRKSGRKRHPVRTSGRRDKAGCSL